MKKALFAGTFDPITLGHVDIIKRIYPLFDELVVAIGVNSTKTTLFSLEQRLSWIQSIFKDLPTITITSYQKLTVDFCAEMNCNYIVRGLRNTTDFTYESHIAQLNKKLSPFIETLFIHCSPELSYISSTMVRDLIAYKGDYSSLVPPEVILPK